MMSSPQLHRQYPDGPPSMEELVTDVVSLGTVEVSQVEVPLDHVPEATACRLIMADGYEVLGHGPNPYVALLDTIGGALTAEAEGHPLNSDEAFERAYPGHSTDDEARTLALVERGIADLQTWLGEREPRNQGS